MTICMQNIKIEHGSPVTICSAHVYCCFSVMSLTKVPKRGHSACKGSRMFPNSHQLQQKAEGPNISPLSTSGDTPEVSSLG